MVIPSQASPWYDNIEAWKVIATSTVSIAVAGATWWGSRLLKDYEYKQLERQKILEKLLEDKQFANQKLVEKRLAIFDEAAPLLNNLYCVVKRVGGWKEFTPSDAIDAKRRLDRIVFINEALFRDEFRQAYSDFIDCCFETYVGPGKDALLRASLDGRRHAPNWDESWADAFTDEDGDPVVLDETYHRVMKCFAGALGAT